MVDHHADKQTPQTPSFGEEGRPLLTCGRCGLKYQASKSTSALRLTYCSFLCELGDLGFSIAGLESMQRTEEEADAPGEPDESEEADRGELAPVD